METLLLFLLGNILLLLLLLGNILLVLLLFISLLLYDFFLNSLLSSSLRATTNAILLNGTFGMTFGTSNCSKHSIVKKEFQKIHRPCRPP